MTMKRYIRWIVLSLLYYSCVFWIYLNWPKRSNRIFVLMYHHVRDKSFGSVGYVSVKRFREQISFLRKWFHILSMKQAVDIIQHKKCIPRMAAVVTFDDGFEDFYTNAYPILKDFGVPATVYVVSHAADSGEPIWTEKIERLIADTRRECIEIGLDGTNRRFELSSPKERLKAIIETKEYLKQISNGDRLRVLENLEYQTGVNTTVKQNGDGPLKWDQIFEMGRGNIEFGAHTMTHPILSKMNDEEAWREISGSKCLIEERTGRPVTSFSYPNGEARDFDDRIKEMVKKAGFSSACCAILGGNDHGSDLFELRRIYVRDEPLPFLLARLCGVVR